MTYSPELKNKVSDTLWRRTCDDLEDVEVEYGIPNFEKRTLVVTGAQYPSLDNKKQEDIPGGKVDRYDIWNYLSDQDHAESMVYTPVPINMAKILEVQSGDKFCIEIIFRKQHV